MILLPTLCRVSIVTLFAAKFSVELTTRSRFAVVTAFTPIVLRHSNKCEFDRGSRSMSQFLSSTAAASATASSTPAPTTTRYILSYDYIPDVLEKRGPYREGHLGLAKIMVADGTCVSGGPTLPPGESVPIGALFIFTTKDAAEKFVAEDPYVANGIVTGHKISEWSVLLGSN